MVVKVFPVRPIPGILPKNKWIDSPIVLDLNKNEILHCMQYGHVYDEDGKVIDNISINKKFTMNQKVVSTKPTSTLNKEPVVLKEIPKQNVSVPKVELVKEEPVVVEPELEEIVSEPIIIEEEIEEEKYFNLKEVSCVKENNSVILELQMDTNSKLEGSLYGLFKITSGTKPTPLEYKVNDEWVKFNNKFADFSVIENGDKLVFRFTPKNENQFAYTVLIKQANDVLVSFEGKVDQTKL